MTQKWKSFSVTVHAASVAVDEMDKKYNEFLLLRAREHRCYWFIISGQESRQRPRHALDTCQAVCSPAVSRLVFEDNCAREVSDVVYSIMR